MSVKIGICESKSGKNDMDKLYDMACTRIKGYENNGKEDVPTENSDKDSNDQYTEYKGLMPLLAALQHKEVRYAVFPLMRGKSADKEKNYIANNRLVYVDSFVFGRSTYVIYSNNKQTPNTLFDTIVIFIDSLMNFKLGQLICTLIAYFGIYVWLIQHVLFNNACDNWIIDVIALIISIGTSSLVANKIKYYPFCGYWKYFATLTREVDEAYKERVCPDILRIVEISADVHGLHLQGWRAGIDQKSTHFSSEYCEVCYTAESKKTGALLYWFSDKTISQIPSDKPISGLVQLRWKRTKNNPRIEIMHGSYAGIDSGIIGQVAYSRISRAEFDRLKGRNFHNMY